MGKRASSMIPARRLVSLPCLFVVAASAFAQQAAAPAQPGTEPNKAAAYYNYSLGHLYAEMAAAYGNRG